MKIFVPFLQERDQLSRLIGKLDSRQGTNIADELGSPRLLTYNQVKSKKNKIQNLYGFSLEQKVKRKKINSLAKDLSMQIQFEKDFSGKNHLNDIITMMQTQTNMLKL